MRRAMKIATAVSLFVLVLAGPALAQSASSLGHLVVLSGRAEVRSGERARNVVVFHGPVQVDGDVQGSVVAFDGPVTISGNVRDNVVAFNGSLTIESGARVGGDVVSRQEPSIAADATVGGRVRRVRAAFTGWGFRVAFRYAVWLGYTMSTLALGLVMVLLLVPRGMDAAAATGRDATGPSIGWGLASFFGLPTVAILALVAVVTIPLGLALLLAMWLLFTVGYVATAWFLGRRILTNPARRTSAFLVGWGILRAAALVPVLAGMAWTVATIFGLGMVLVATWRARRAAGPPPPPALAAELAA